MKYTGRLDARQRAMHVLVDVRNRGVSSPGPVHARGTQFCFCSFYFVPDCVPRLEGEGLKAKGDGKREMMGLRTLSLSLSLSLSRRLEKRAVTAFWSDCVSESNTSHTKCW